MYTIRMPNIRILHIVHASFPSQSGYVIRTENILNAIIDRDLTIDVVGGIFAKRLEQTTRGSQFVKNGRQYYQLLNPTLIKVLSLLNRIPVLGRLLRYIEILLNSVLIILTVKIKDYDIIHGHSSYRNGLSAFILSKIFQKPFVYDIHALTIDALEKNTIGYKIGYFAERLLIENANALIVIDNNLCDSIKREFNIQHSAIYVAPNGISSDMFKMQKTGIIAKEIAVVPENKVLIGIDNSKPIEGFGIVRKNLDYILQMVPDIHFVVFADKSASKNLPGMTFLPKLPANKMPKFYSDLELFIMPRPKNTQSDTITPLKILELMSCETLVIVNDVGGLTHCIKHAVTGFVLKDLSVHEIIESIKFALSYGDKETLKRQARQWVIANKSWGDSAQKYNDCYSNILLSKNGI